MGRSSQHVEGYGEKAGSHDEDERGQRDILHEIN
jgi:hypothetical protein